MSEIFVESACHVKSHILEVEFSNGHKSHVDFSPFIYSSEHPDYEKYKKESEFLKYEIIDGNLNWDDYTMIFPVEDLYTGKLIK